MKFRNFGDKTTSDDCEGQQIEIEKHSGLRTAGLSFESRQRRTDKQNKIHPGKSHAGYTKNSTLSKVPRGKDLYRNIDSNNLPNACTSNYFKTPLKGP